VKNLQIHWPGSSWKSRFHHWAHTRECHPMQLHGKIWWCWSSCKSCRHSMHRKCTNDPFVRRMGRRL